MTQLRVLGAAGTVTGSRHLFESQGQRWLVDCGLFQGLKELRLRNWDPFPVSSSSIAAVALSHGHLDHVGYLPRLVKEGFNGPIYATEPTLAVAEVVLRDGGHLQEEEAALANRHGYSRHKPALPLYTSRDVERTLKKFRPVPVDTWLDLPGGARCRWTPVGHILGACFLTLELEGRQIVISGDIGRPDDPLLYPPQRPQAADWLLMESTYGDRLHPSEDLEALFKEWIQEVHTLGSTLYLPVFAVERTQMLLLILHRLMQSGAVPEMPIILDSPMGTQVLSLFNRFPDWHRLDADASQVLTERVRVVESVQESLRLAQRKSGPRIVLAGAGMLTGGRILNYLVHDLPHEENLLVLTGYQAEGTRGRRLQEGATTVRIQGNDVPVRARIRELHSLSAHADQRGLLDWLQDLKSPPEQIVLVHGEGPAAEALCGQIQERYNWPVTVAKRFQEFHF